MKRRRTEVTVEVRKNRRKETLQERRNIPDSDSNDDDDKALTTDSAQLVKQALTTDSAPLLKQANSTDEAIQYAAAVTSQHHYHPYGNAEFVCDDDDDEDHEEDEEDPIGQDDDDEEFELVDLTSDNEDNSVPSQQTKSKPVFASFMVHPIHPPPPEDDPYGYDTGDLTTESETESEGEATEPETEVSEDELNLDICNEIPEVSQPELPEHELNTTAGADQPVHEIVVLENYYEFEAGYDYQSENDATTESSDSEEENCVKGESPEIPFEYDRESDDDEAKYNSEEDDFDDDSGEEEEDELASDSDDTELISSYINSNPYFTSWRDSTAGAEAPNADDEATISSTCVDKIVENMLLCDVESAATYSNSMVDPEFEAESLPFRRLRRIRRKKRAASFTSESVVLTEAETETEPSHVILHLRV